MEPLIVMLLLLGVFSSESEPDPGEDIQPVAMKAPVATSGPSEQGSEGPTAVNDDYRRRSACQATLHDVIYRDLRRSKKPPVTEENVDDSDCEGGCGDE